MNFKTLLKYAAIGASILALLMLIFDSVWSSLFVVFALLTLLLPLLTWKGKKREVNFENPLNNITREAQRAIQTIDEIQAELRR